VLSRVVKYQHGISAYQGLNSLHGAMCIYCFNICSCDGSWIYELWSMAHENALQGLMWSIDKNIPRIVDEEVLSE
jgi:hypothetical protein